MTDEEVNKIIAEYMGAKYYETHDPAPVLILNGYEFSIEGFDHYTKSLDSLIPVWNKLGKNYAFMIDKFCVTSFVGFGENDQFKERECVKKDTIQKSAAYLTAKAIKELDAI